MDIFYTIFFAYLALGVLTAIAGMAVPFMFKKTKAYTMMVYHIYKALNCLPQFWLVTAAKFVKNIAIWPVTTVKLIFYIKALMAEK